MTRRGRGRGMSRLRDVRDVRRRSVHVRRRRVRRLPRRRRGHRRTTRRILTGRYFVIRSGCPRPPAAAAAAAAAAPASDPTGESAPCVDPPPFATDACAAAAASASRLSVTVLGSPGRGLGGSPPLAANVDSGLNPPKPGDAAPDCGPFAFASRPRTSHSFAIAATDPASDLASTSGIVRLSSGSPARRRRRRRRERRRR